MQINTFVCSNFFPAPKELHIEQDYLTIKLYDILRTVPLSYTWEASNTADVETDLDLQTIKSSFERFLEAFEISTQCNEEEYTIYFSDNNSRSDQGQKSLFEYSVLRSKVS